MSRLRTRPGIWRGEAGTSDRVLRPGSPAPTDELVRRDSAVGSMARSRAATSASFAASEATATPLPVCRCEGAIGPEAVASVGTVRVPGPEPEADIARRSAMTWVGLASADPSAAAARPPAGSRLRAEPEACPALGRVAAAGSAGVFSEPAGDGLAGAAEGAGAGTSPAPGAGVCTGAGAGAGAGAGVGAGAGAGAGAGGGAGAGEGAGAGAGGATGGGGGGGAARGGSKVSGST